MNNPPIIKPDPSKTLGGIPKVKFKPKIPVKKQDVESEVQEPVKSSKDNLWKNNSGNDRGRGRGKQGGRGGGERDRNNSSNRFVMPTGEAFFQGGTTSSSSTSIIKIGMTTGGGGVTIKAETSSLNRDTLSQDGEVIAGDSTAKIRNEDDEANAGPSADSRKGGSRPMVYDSLGPVSLPFSHWVTPESDKPLFASAGDLNAIDAEEQESMYLLQLPSDLKLSGLPAATDADAAQGSNARDSTSSAGKSGLLGKIRVFASGRVVLFTRDGRQFEVHGGLKASFLQQVATVALSSPPPPIETAPAATSRAGGGKGGAPAAEEAAGGRVLGSLAFLGSVTQKLVVVSDLVTREGGLRESQGTSGKDRNGSSRDSDGDNPSSALPEDGGGLTD